MKGVRRQGGRRGSALLELALCAPVLFLMTFGAVDVSRGLYTAIAVSSAARAGVQYGMQDSTKASDFEGMAAAARADASGLTGFAATASNFCGCPDGGTVACGGSCGAGSAASYIRVQTSANYTTLIPYPGFPRPLTIRSSASIRTP